MARSRSRQGPSRTARPKTVRVTIAPTPLIAKGPDSRTVRRNRLVEARLRAGLAAVSTDSRSRKKDKRAKGDQKSSGETPTLTRIVTIRDTRSRERLSDAEIGLMVREIRKYQGVHGHEIAKKVSLQPAEFFRLERGEATFTDKMLRKLAKALGNQFLLRVTSATAQKKPKRKGK